MRFLDIRSMKRGIAGLCAFAIIITCGAFTSIHAAETVTISTVEEFENMRQSNSSAHFVLANDLYFNSDYESYESWGTKAPAYKLTENPRGFIGTFDGGGHTLYGVYSDGSSLFGRSSGDIINLKISNFYVANAPVLATSIYSQKVQNVQAVKGIIKNNKDRRFCGGLTDRASASSFEDVSVNIKMALTDCTYVGLICGYGEDFYNCSSKGSITQEIKHLVGGYSYHTITAGMVGGIIEGIMENCVNAANVTVTLPNKPSAGCNVGGLTANATLFKDGDRGQNVIKNCKNTGKVTLKTKYTTGSGVKSRLAQQTSYVAGIGAILNATSITSCTNTGSISASFSNYVGGISALQNGAVKNCLNKGNVTTAASKYVAGICAELSGTASQCENRGTIKNTEKYQDPYTYLPGGNVAGIVCNLGNADGAKAVAKACKNTGTIQYVSACNWGSRAAGIVNCIYPNAVIDGCYNTGSLKGGWISGIAAAAADRIDSNKNAKNAVIKNCVNTGSITNVYGDGRNASIIYFPRDAVISKCYSLTKNSKELKTNSTVKEIIKKAGLK